MRTLPNDYTAIYDFPPLKRGDSFDPKNFEILINGDPPLHEITEVKLELRKHKKVYKRYINTDNSIVITGPGTFYIPGHILDIPEGEYNYDLQITYANSVVKTYMKGIWKIWEDYTK